MSVAVVVAVRSCHRHSGNILWSWWKQFWSLPSSQCGRDKRGARCDENISCTQRPTTIGVRRRFPNHTTPSCHAHGFPYTFNLSFVARSRPKCFWFHSYFVSGCIVRQLPVRYIFTNGRNGDEETAPKKLHHTVIASWFYHKGRLCLNLHRSFTTDVYKLDAYAGAGSIMTCDNMRLGCIVPADWLCFVKIPHYKTL